MAGEYLGEIRLFGGNYAPRGYLLCDGQLLQSSQYPQLAALLGETYGGDGATTFALPDLRGRVPLHMGQGQGLSNRQIGEVGGLEAVALDVLQIQSHLHGLRCESADGKSATPGGASWAAPSNGTSQYSSLTAHEDLVPMSPQCIADAGESAPHENMPPFLAVTYIIAVQGLVPPPQ